MTKQHTAGIRDDGQHDTMEGCLTHFGEDGASGKWGWLHPILRFPSTVLQAQNEPRSK